MGEDNLIRDDLVFSVKDGNAWQPIGPLDSGNTFSNDGLFIEGDQQKEYIWPLAKPASFSFKAELPPCPHKKRFIKLLMAGGTSRNDAQKAAEMVRRKNYSYSVGLFWWRIAKMMP